MLPCQQIAIYSWEPGQKWWEQELWPGSMPLIHKQLGRHPSNRRNNLKRARKPTSTSLSDELWCRKKGGGRRRGERRCLPRLSLQLKKKKKKHIRGLWRRLENSGRPNAAASPGLVWPRCLFPVCGLLNGPNYHRYELQQGGRFCRGLQLPPGIAWEMLFSAGYVINKAAGSICWRRIDFPRDRKRRPDLRCERMFQRRGLTVASF